MKFLLLSIICLLAFSCAKKEAEMKSDGMEQSAEEKEMPMKRVFFKNLESGDQVKSPFKVIMGVEGMEIEPAGQLSENKGHHHIIINKGSIAEGTVIPNDAEHIHYGAGQTEAEIALDPGKYTLTMQFADGVHRSYGEALSVTVEIEVVE
jgi:hypothetical protein